MCDLSRLDMYTFHHGLVSSVHTSGTGVPTKPGPTKPGHNYIGLDLGNKVKDRVRVDIWN